MDVREQLHRRLQQPPLDRCIRSQLQDAVHKYVLENSDYLRQANFTTIHTSDLGLMFHAIDEEFFSGCVGRLCEQAATRPLSFRLSTRMTATGGMTTMLRPRDRRSTAREFEIAIATTPLYESFRDSTKLNVGGLPCVNRLQALQRIMEHEVVHLVEMLLWDDSNCSANPFKRIVNGFFGHTASNHRLMTPRDVARSKLGLAIGDTVCFQVAGETIRGTLNRVTKRATVLVADPNGAAYDDGQRYRKYYVPLSRIRHV